MASGYTVLQRDLVAYRRTRVAGLLLCGLRQFEIAQALDVSPGVVAADIKIIRSEWRAARQEAYDNYQAQELASLALLERAAMKKALEGSMFAIDRVLAIKDRRARMIGLDAPTKHIVSKVPEDVVDSLIEQEIEYRKTLDELAAHRQREQQEQIELSRRAAAELAAVAESDIVDAELVPPS